MSITSDTPSCDQDSFVSGGVSALALVFIALLATSGLKTWSKSLIMKSFKMVAEKFIDPGGAAVVPYGACLAKANL
jgi:hypothetical protein